MKMLNEKCKFRFLLLGSTGRKESRGKNKNQNGSENYAPARIDGVCCCIIANEWDYVSPILLEDQNRTIRMEKKILAAEISSTLASFSYFERRVKICEK